MLDSRVFRLAGDTRFVVLAFLEISVDGGWSGWGRIGGVR
jgi:hypothetical protein